LEGDMSRLLLLDLDGTVVDTLSFIIRCFRDAVTPCTTHIPTDAEIVATFGPAEEECIDRLLKQHHEQGWLRQPYVAELTQAAAHRFHMLYAAGYEQGMVQCYIGMPELIREARSNSWKTAIFTGKGRTSALATLEHVGLLRDFDAIISSDDVKQPKPAPDGVLMACQKTGVSPAQTLFVGDNPADTKAGQAAGANTAAAMWGAVFPNETLATKPDHVLHDVASLAKLLHL
jgi:HAD superfamily hydrolase (TIGR01509 family)